VNDFGTLRSLLHDGARDRETFDRIVRVFVHTLEPEEAERVWLPYALEHLAPWPDDARALELRDGAPPALPLALARTLSLKGKWTDDVIWEVFGSAWFAGVRRLEVRGSYRKGQIRVVGSIARSGVLARLTHLSLYECDLDDASMRAFSKCAAPHLTSLDLRCKSVGLDAWVEFANAARWPAVTALDLTGIESGDAVLRAFAEAGRLEGCERLWMTRCRVGDEGVQVLAALGQGSALERLRELVLFGNKITSAGAALLARTFLPSLEALALGSNPLGDTGALALLRCGGFPRLESLYLSRRRRNVRGWEDATVAEVPEHLPDRSEQGPLVTLDLSNRAFPEPVIELIVQTRRLSGVRELRFAGAALSVRNARALGSSPSLSALRTLVLRSSDLGDDGLEALCLGEGRVWRERLEVLDLSLCDLTDASSGVLPEAGMACLTELVLDGNPIGPAWIEALTTPGALPALKRLDLNDCVLGDDALAILAAATHPATLTHLTLRGAEVTSRGVQSLFEGAVMEGLVMLHVRGPRLDADAMLALADNPLAASLESLVMQPYAWTPATWRRLATSPHLSSLEDFSVAYSVDLARTLDAELRGGVVLNPWARKVMRHQST
jgi:hypothetical protein